MKPTTPETELPSSTRLTKSVFQSPPRKAALLLLSFALLLAGGAAAVRGQSALDGFDPNASSMVRIVVVQPDGKTLIGGDFTNILGVARIGIARLNADGTLDTAFNPNANDFVRAIAVQANGKILVGGLFNGSNSIGGQARNRIARLDATTGLADAFNPNANNTVQTIVVQADGKILVGGFFTGANSIGGQTRNRLARLDATTGLADSFNPDANNTVVAIAVQADGKVLVGGSFSGANSIGGQTRNRIARLDATTGLADSFDPNSTNAVQAIAVQADGKILVGGLFAGVNSIGGQTRNRLARLDATTGLADSFDPNANNNVNAIAVQTDGKILVGGNFSGANSIGGQTRNRLARLDAATGLADSFDPNANNNVFAIAVQPDGKILVGGIFTTLTPNGGAAVTRNRIARLETDGRLDQTLNLTAIGSTVFATAVQPDGKVLIGGNFTSILGVARTNIARLNTDGTLDTAFNPNAKSTVQTIAVQADGKVLVGGSFIGANSIGGQTRNFIARLDATTGLADAFNPNADGEVKAIAVQADGKILAGGGFATIGGQPRIRIARLDPITGTADSFNPNANNPVQAIAVQADGKILVGGQFSNVGGQPRNRIARLDPLTGTADAFNPNANQSVNAIAVQADGKILVGGNFSGANSIGGQTRNRLARLDATTGLADSFDPNANNNVNAIAVQTDGKILAGGSFTTIGGQPRSIFARLSNDTAALQDLALTQTAITWTRGGSSPQFARVTFESSANNVTYSSLGSGTAAGSNWTLAGLNNLSVGQSLYIRTRGYYRGGLQNGSESIAESVWNVVVPPPLPFLNIQRSANTNVVLSWPTNFTGFTLEANTNLTTNVWSVVSPAPAVSGTNNVVTNATSGSTRFYRLRN